MYEENVLKDLNEAQKKAVVDTNGQLLVLAGAGSGKTRVLTTRVAYLVKCCGVDPYNILAITFTNKAAGEMKSRINLLLGEKTEVWISTFHSMCAQIQFRECEKIGYSPNFSIYSEVESGRVLKRILRQREERGEKEATKLFDAYFSHIKRVKGFDEDPTDYAATIPDTKISRGFLSIFNDYQTALKESNAMDFDDLLINTVKLFNECPKVLYKYSNRFKYIHVDEFQDTNKLQFELIYMLSSAHKNIFVVGDEDQSIYGWRGAIIANIMDFKRHFTEARIYKLEENYRSTSFILNAANRVIENNRNRYGKHLFTSREGGRRVEVFNAYNDREEVDYVLRNINDLVTLAGVNYGDIAILMRANSISRQFEEALTIYNMPYRVYGGQRFYERKEIKDVLAYLRIALNPKDIDSAARIINVPKRALGDTTVQRLLEYCKDSGETLFEAIGHVEKLNIFNHGTVLKLQGFAELWKRLIAVSTQKNSVDFVEYVMKTSGLLDMYHNDTAEPDRFENVKEFVSAVAEFQKDNPNKTINDFMRSVALISDTDEIDNGNTVTLATVHAVKGLEFPVVFIVALEENIFPSSRASDVENIEEERRLMYVAITRAKDRLYCSSARSRFRYNQRQANMRSRFVGEMIGATTTTPTQSVAQADKTKTQKPQIKPFPGADFAGNNNFGSSVKINSAEYVSGKKVLHPKFGEGVIISTNGEGNEKVASISFEGLGIKKFVVAMANLKVIG